MDSDDDDASGGGLGEEKTGIMMRWMGDKGFGFIQPEGGGEDLFCHARALEDGEGSVQEGNKVLYKESYNDRKGKNEAAEVKLAPGGEGDHRPARSGGGGGGGGPPEGE